MNKPYYVYMLRCVDGSLYTGITTDVKRRFAEHLEGGVAGAKYTKHHPPKEIAAVWQAENRSIASKLEWRIKHLTKQQKETLCEVPEQLSEFISMEEIGRTEAVSTFTPEHVEEVAP